MARFEGTYGYNRMCSSIDVRLSAQMNKMHLEGDRKVLY